MTYSEIIEQLKSGKANNLVVDNKDGIIFVELINFNNELDLFKITINYKVGKTLIQKI